MYEHGFIGPLPELETALTYMARAHGYEDRDGVVRDLAPYVDTTHLTGVSLTTLHTLWFLTFGLDWEVILGV